MMNEVHLRTDPCETPTMNDVSVGALHHVELWVPDFDRATAEWGWLLPTLGYHELQTWTKGCSWTLGATYIVVEQSPDLVGKIHQRKAPGLNHLAFHAGPRAQVDRLSEEGRDHGWNTLFAERYPHAGGPGHYAAYLENSDGFEVELIASQSG